ncbi:hypothetical protein [Cochlodiniinecator piscidefendens]|uniref:hypothetical protein n=1 Tax=Cochlodiniinecator piscidefendens TaxID=2715756 RepID=UPI00140BF0C1|nr:hypothetical protein [Cochlodiniinecator piscidefendens]
MQFNKLVDGLCNAPSEGAELNARMALMEWVLTLPQGTDTRAEARVALKRCADGVQSKALVLFEKMLREIAETPTITPIRRGGARKKRHLH